MQRLCIPALVLVFLVAMPTPMPRRVTHSRALLRSPAQVVRNSAMACPVYNTTTSSPQVVAPTSGIAVSNSVPLAVVPPTDGTDSVDVCAVDRDSAGNYAPGQGSVVASLPSATGQWSGSWDVSGFPSQSNLTLLLVAHQPVGNQWFLIATVQGIVIDHSPPSSGSATIGQPQYTIGGVTYIGRSTRISLSSVDPPLDDGSAGSGVTVIYHQIDDGPAIPFNTSGSFVFTGLGLADGPHTLTYWAADSAGNMEAPHTLSFSVDREPPTVTPLVTGPFNAGGTAYSPVSVSFTATDTGSGVLGIYYSVDPTCALAAAPVETLCEHLYQPGQSLAVTTTSQLSYIAFDEVGNTTGVATLPITVATPTPPSIPFATDVPSPSQTTTPTRTATATHTPRPTATPSATHTPTATHTATPIHTPAPTHTATPTHAPTAAHTPGPTPTWAPIDGPPIPNRTPAARQRKNAVTSHAAPPTPAPLHAHVLPSAVPARRQTAHRRPRQPAGGKGERTGGYIVERVLPIRNSEGRYTESKGRRTWGWT